MEWISVKDRLPEEKGQYIVAYHPCYWDDVDESKTVIGVDSFRKVTKGHQWAKHKYQRVTHWLPYPAPPEVTP